MFSRRKKNYRVFVVTALIIAICVLIIMILWPKAPEEKNEEIETGAKSEVEADITQKEEDDTKPANQAYYIVKKYGDTISVFLITDDGTQIKLEDTEIIYELLPPEDQANFEKGVILQEQEDLLSLLQDFEG